MTFDAIMQQIKRGMTGARDHDVPYIQEQSEQYKNDPLEEKIGIACESLLYDILVRGGKADSDRSILQPFTSFTSVVIEASTLQEKGKTNDALVLTEALIRIIEPLDYFRDDSANEYRCFDEGFEHMLYANYTRTSRKIHRPLIPFSWIYAHYGNVLLDLHRIKDAQRAFEKALAWNPAKSRFALSVANSSIPLHDDDALLRATLKAFPYAFEPSQVACCFESLGRYFMSKGLWKEALACCSISRRYDKSSQSVKNMLHDIHAIAGDIIPATMDDMAKLSRKYGFPLGVDPFIVRLSSACGDRFMELQNYVGARYYYQIAYALNADERIGKILATLPKQ